MSLGLLENMDSNLKDVPMFLLEGIRKSSDKIAIFCNPGGIKLPQKIQSVYSLLENSVFEVKANEISNFHPKMWFIKYSDDDGNAYIKIIVLSRNLTFDRSWDVSFAFTGRVGRHRSRTKNENIPLRDMLEFVKVYANKDKKDKISELQENILDVKEFELESPFESYEFMPIGIPEYKGNDLDLFNTHNELLIVSPFLSDDIIKRFEQSSRYTRNIITRRSSITNKTLDAFNNGVYAMKDIIVDGGDEESIEQCQKQDIHGKLYFESGYDGNFLYLGSANASHNAFYNNVEFLIKLKFKPRTMSYQKFIGDFLPDEDNPFELVTNVERNKKEEEEDLYSKQIKEIIWAIKDARVISNGTNYDVQVNFKKLNPDIRGKIAPLMRKNTYKEIEDLTTLEKLTITQLSEFYVIKVGDKEVVVKIKTKDIPKDRDDKIYQSIIQNKDDFYAYVSFLLGDSYTESAYELREYMEIRSSSDGNSKLDDNAVIIYEKMLQIIIDNPNKLKDIEAVMKRLGSNIVSEDFKKMYNTFILAAKKVK
jgi:HKD family nuclease